MLVICREIDKNTGEIAVYPIDAEVTDRLLFILGIRQRCNPELRYFVTTKAHYEGFCGCYCFHPQKAHPHGWSHKESGRLGALGIGGWR